MSASTGIGEGRWHLASVALLLALALPFLSRAHAIDDPLYLTAAREVLSHPFAPLAGASFWHDRPATLFDDLYNPPLTAYLLALPVALAGGSEVAVHLLMLGLAAASLLVAAAAGRRLGLEPRLILLLAASPVLAAGSLSAMADVPFLLLTLLALDAGLRGRGLASGFWVGLSALTKYSGLLTLVPVLLALREDRGSRPRALVTTLAVFGGWCAWSLAAYGRLHPLSAGRFLQLGGPNQGEQLVSFVAALGVAGLPAVLGLLRWERFTIAMGIAGAGLGYVVRPWLATPANGLLLSLAVAAGTALLGAALLATVRTRHASLASAVWLPALYAIALVYFGAARYALPLLPPLLWLLARGGQLRSQASGWRWGSSIAASGLVSVGLLWGDAGQAGAWRDLAGRLPVARRGLQSGHWGFQWYAARVGYAALDPRAVLESGDRVAEPMGIHGAGLSPAQAAVLQGTGRLEQLAPPIRVMDRGVGAGLYSSGWGVLPFAFRADAREVLRLSAPAAWVLEAVQQPVPGRVALDLGSPEARQVELDGWSADESFTDGGVRRTFAWMVGPEAALRVPLPVGARRVSLRAFPGAEAVGPLDVVVGPSAHARLELTPGWRDYGADIVGEVAGGPTTVVLRPAGFKRPGLFSRERRAVSVAVDRLAFDDGNGEGNAGFWPVAVREGVPGMFVADTTLPLPVSRGGDRLRLRVAGVDIEVSWEAEGAVAAPLWAARARSDAGCEVDVRTPAQAGRLLLRARQATFWDLRR